MDCHGGPCTSLGRGREVAVGTVGWCWIWKLLDRSSTTWGFLGLWKIEMSPDFRMPSWYIHNDNLIVFFLNVFLIWIINTKVGSYQMLVVLFCSGLMLADGAMMLTLHQKIGDFLEHRSEDQWYWESTWYGIYCIRMWYDMIYCIPCQFSGYPSS